MALPTQESFNTWYNQEFESDLKTRRKLKAIAKYNKLSIKTKIKKLKDNLEYNMQYLQAKFNAEVKIVEQGGHPELGFEEQYETHLADDAFNATLKIRNKRLRKQGLKYKF
jgi:hypothetical protein